MSNVLDSLAARSDSNCPPPFVHTTNGILLLCSLCNADLDPGIGMPSRERQPSMSKMKARLGCFVGVSSIIVNSQYHMDSLSLFGCRSL